MFGRILLAICAAAWCVCAAFALAAIYRHARRAMRQLGVSARVVFLLAAAAGVMLAGGKGGSVAVHDDYIADAGSYLTNDVAHVAIAKRTPNLPDSTEILVYARELSSTNAADWFRLSPHLTYADHPYDYALPNATNYSVLVSSSFVPEPTVHTNGVWALRGFEIPGHAGRYAFGNSRVRKDVPYDAEVEHLESTGTQWIDTGVKPSGDLATYIIFSYQQIANNVSAFGSRSNSSVNDRYWLNYDGKFEIGYGGWESAIETTSVGAINTIAFNEIVNGDHVFTVNGRSSTHHGRPNTSVNIIAFGRVVGNTAPVLSKMRLYSMSMKRNGTLVRDFIPVRVGNVGYMFDRVSRQLFGNQGTGTFIVGPDKQ